MGALHWLDVEEKEDVGARPTPTPPRPTPASCSLSAFKCLRLSDWDSWARQLGS